MNIACRLTVTFAVTIAFSLSTGGCRKKKINPGDAGHSVTSKPKVAAPLSPPKAEKRRWRFEMTPNTAHQIGRLATTSGHQEIRAGAGKKGFLLFGPYVPLKAGRYRVTLGVTAAGNPGAKFGFVDVFVSSKQRKGGGRSVARRDLAGTGGAVSTMTLEFDAGPNPARNLVYEFRVFANGKGETSVRQVVLERL